MIIRRLHQLFFFVAFTLSCFAFFAQGVSSGVSMPHADKVGHFLTFFVLATLFSQAFSRSSTAILTFAVAYGAGVELIQSMIPGRQASLPDVLADVLGAWVALVLVVPVYNRLITHFFKRQANESNAPSSSQQ